MKSRIITSIMIVMAMFAMSSCSDSDNPDRIELADKSQREIVLAQVKSQISVSFESENAWSAVTQASWLRLSPASGEGGDATLLISADTNNEVNQREATVDIVSGDVKETIHVVQAQKDALVIAKEAYLIDSDGGKLDLYVGHNLDFEMKCQAEWIHVDKTRAYEETVVSVMVDENESYDDRVADIIFKLKGKNIEQKVNIRQSQKAGLVVDQDKYERSFNHEAQKIYIRIKTNTEYKVKIEGASNWLTQSTTTRALEPEMLSFDMMENKSTDMRSAKIIISSEDIERVVVVHQSGIPVLKIDKDEDEISWEGGEIKVTVTTNLDFETIINKCDWIHVVDTRAEHVEDNVVTLKVDKNEGAKSRSTNINFKPVKTSKPDAWIKITQTSRKLDYEEGDKLPAGVYVAYIVDGRKHAIITENYETSDDKTPFGVLVSDGEHQVVVSLKSSKNDMSFQYPVEFIDGLTTKDEADEAKTDFDGRKNTEVIINWRDAEEGRTADAATFASEYEYAGVSGWYLPSAGEGLLISKESWSIYAAFNKIGGDTDSIFVNFWSSTQKSATHGWKWGEGNYDVSSNNKNSRISTRKVRPVTDF